MLKLAKKYLSLRRNIIRPREAIRAMQEEQLHSLLAHALEHSAWHRTRFENAGLTAETIQAAQLSDLPTMDKSDLMAHFDEIVTDPELSLEALRAFDAENNQSSTLYQGKYHIVHSSGSTGKPGYFVYDSPAWEQMLAGIIRGALWEMNLLQIWGLLARKAKILYVAATDGRYGGALAVGDGLNDMGLPQRFLDINQPMAEWIGVLKSWKPDVVIGYPSAIKLLCDLAEEQRLPFRPERIITCGEPLPAGLRAWLTDKTGAVLVNFYGASESLAMGVAGPKDSCMVLFDDLNLIEVIDGEMYLPCLYNKVQPLIRYHITDHLVLHEGQGAFTSADILLSRNEDILWFKDQEGNKEFLHPLAVEGFCLEGLTDYQFVKQSNSSFTMRAVAEESRQLEILEAMKKQMRKILREKHLEWVEFQVQFVREILPDIHTGKKKMIVCEMKDRPCAVA